MCHVLFSSLTAPTIVLSVVCQAGSCCHQHLCLQPPTDLQAPQLLLKQMVFFILPYLFLFLGRISTVTPPTPLLPLSTPSLPTSGRRAGGEAGRVQGLGGRTGRRKMMTTTMTWISMMRIGWAGGGEGGGEEGGGEKVTVLLGRLRASDRWSWRVRRLSCAVRCWSGGGMSLVRG